MKNKRGTIFFAPFTPLCLGIFAVVVTVAMLTRPQHIIKRANEKCIGAGQTSAQCSTWVAGLTQDERIEYIRDK